MGLLDLIPGFSASPAGNWWNANNDMVANSFGGMVGHGNDPRDILKGALGGLKHGKSVDEEQAIIEQQRAQQQAAIDQQAQQQTYTRQKLAEWGPDYADLIDALDGGGMTPAAVWGEALQRRNPKPAAPISVSPGETLVNPSTFEPMYTGPASPDKPTSDIQNYEYYREAEMSAGRPPLSMFEWQQERSRAGATNIDFNQNQGAAAGFADRMTSAETILSRPEIEAALVSVEQDIKRQAPMGMDNFLVSKEYQMADQAKRDFINSILRRESGAVISPSEFENAEKQYFPRPGDSQEVIEQKRRNRQIAIEGVKRAAGPNYAAPSMIAPGTSDPYTKYGLER